MQIVYKRLSPVCYLPSGILVCYKDGFLYLLEGGAIINKYRIFESYREKYLGKSKLLYRLLRLGIRAAIAIDDENVLLSIGKSIYEFNFHNQVLSKGWNCKECARPLIFSNVFGIESLDSGIYFGGYLGNMNKDPVSIYKRTSVDKWQIVYTFPKGLINHIHNIIPDPYRNCMWIFTGDFEDAAAIWRVSNNFKNVDRVVCNDQRYRACVIHALPEGLLYATDSPFSDNYIYLLNPYSFDLKSLYPIHGSSIYGCQWKDQYVFSSTVEGDGRNMNRMEFFFTRKRGNGIKDDFVHLYSGNLREGFREIYKEKKDNMPYYTFQFGVLRFPYGINNNDELYFQSVATVNNDLDLMKIEGTKL